jgi:hypothetical protein
MTINPQYFYPTVIVNITSLNGGVFGTVKPTDVYPAVDVTDQTQSPQGTTKPYQIQQLVNYIFGALGFYLYAPVLAAATGNLTAIYNNGISGVGATLTNSGSQTAFILDGQTGVLNGRYLIQMQSSPLQNGIYILTNVGSSTTNWVLTRSIDFNQANTATVPPPNGIIEDGIVFVETGFLYAGIYWQDTFLPPVVVGTTAINWSIWQFVPAQFIWQVITTPSVNALVEHGYITNRASQVQVLLPSTFNIGDVVEVRGLGTGGWAVLPNVGQTIQFGSVTASTSIQSDIQYSNITLRGIVPGLTWTIDSVNSNPTFL